ncbi:MAG: sodium-dependent transporter [Phycisphaerae bacterium]|nr:sodium-dependent transporter [Phycisphaerae bacterium]
MAESPLLEEQRENWGSRAGFILAAVGSAVGLGNLWGFPYKVHAHGGGAFLVPYLLAMIVIGIPLMILEFSLGHMTQRAAPDAYRGINRRSEPVGWWGILLGFVIITYYPVVLAWCGGYLVECLKSIVTGNPLPWAGEGVDGVENAKTFFNNDYLHQWTDSEVAAGHRGWDFGRLIGPVVASLAVIWVLMYLCIFRGVRLVGKVVLWTVPVPWIMLMILTIRGLTLPGATQGLNFYLAPDWDMLTKPETWRWAFGQMFFSMSLAFGVMITYASFLHRKSDINNNAAIIGLADVATSFVAGVAVFSTLGAMAFITTQAGAPVPVENVVDKGPHLAFIAFPYALAQLPGAAWFGAVFFVALLLLGIDSAFSITESVLASLVDKTGWKRSWTLIGLTVVGFGLGLVYCTRGGMNWLGGIDSFINSAWGGIVLLGLLEAAVVGWGYRIGRLREHANERSDWRLGIWWDWIIRYVAPLALSGLFTWSLLEKFAGGEFLYDADGVLQVPTLVGLIVAVTLPVLAVVFSAIRSPGANTHAVGVGRPRQGRGIGVLGTVLVATALAALAYAFRLMASFPAMKFDIWRVAGVPATWLAPLAGVLALAAAALGSIVVWGAEHGQRRPSGFARLAGGLGVMTVGAAGGFWMGAYLLTHPTVESAAQSRPREATELAGEGYIVLAVMVAVLVIGLGWCFYRAVKAAGGPETPQYAEAQGDDTGDSQ